MIFCSGLLGRPSRLHTVTFVAAGFAVFCIVACTANTVINADLAGRGAVPANAAEIQACQDSCAARASCDGVQTTDCSQKCGQSTSDAAVGFKKCVDTSKCDPQCDTQLGAPEPKPPTETPKPVPTPDASAPDATPDVIEQPDTGPTDESLSVCLSACNTSFEVKECMSGGANQCAGACKTATPTKRLAFGECANQSNDCSTWMVNCFYKTLGNGSP